MARKPARKELNPLEQAQDLIYSAWEVGTAKRRVDLARKAIAMSPLCADAYVLLAQHAKAASDEQLDLWRSGVKAGEAALGSEFDELAGEFWGWLETRPYMRAREGLAHTLWMRGARDEAIEHLKDMLRLNPDDNQGVRYELVAWLAEADRDVAIADLQKDYPDEDDAMWTWPIALAAFWRFGDTAESGVALAAAAESNRHVAAYLTGALKLPKNQPPFYSPGEKDEASLYVAEQGAVWKATPGAIDWLNARIPPVEKKRPVRTRHRVKG